MEAKKLLKINLTEDKILKRRQEVRECFIRNSTNIHSGYITKISIADVKLLFDLYDKYFFNKYFEQEFYGEITFSLSKRMTRSAGKTIVPKSLMELEYSKNIYEIRMGVEFFLKYNQVDRTIYVNGIRTIDSVHAFQLVFEHELCHVIEFYIFKKSNCKQERFKNIAKNIFAHKDVYHQLPTVKEIAVKKFGLYVGDKIKFRYHGKIIIGIINSINKKATVMVLDDKGIYLDKSGRKYSKFYVPLELIERN